MKISDEIHTGYFRIVKRLPSSRDGNPRYLCEVNRDDGEAVYFRTAPDSSLGYSVPNYNAKRVTVSLVTFYGHATLADIKLSPA